MAYLKLWVKDNASTKITAWIWASDTTITVTWWTGALFPSWQQFIWTLIQYTTPADPTTAIVKREKVLVTNRSTDTLTITRWYDWDSATTFLASDYFYLNVTAKTISDIQDEVTRIETDKLNKAWALRTWNWAWKVTYNNWSWNETEVTLWAANKVWTSNWATSAPTFETPTVDISWTTEVTTFVDADMVLWYNAWIWANRKISKKTILESINWFADFNWSDWAVSWWITITWSDNTVITKNYTTFQPWANTITITPTWCLLIIKCSWNVDLTWTTFTFTWKWTPWWAWTAGNWNWTSATWATASTFQRSTTTWQGWLYTAWVSASWGWWWASVSTNWSATAAYWSATQWIWATVPVNYDYSLYAYNKILNVWPWCWGWWWAGYTWATWWNWWAWWWAVLLQIKWNLTLSSTTFNFWGNVWSAWTWSSNVAGWGWWWWWGFLFIEYSWTLTWTSTPTVTGWAWWAWYNWGSAGWAWWAGWYIITKAII